MKKLLHVGVGIGFAFAIHSPAASLRFSAFGGNLIRLVSDLARMLVSSSKARAASRYACIMPNESQL
jgi:hypothetical protein